MCYLCIVERKQSITLNPNIMRTLKSTSILGRHFLNSYRATSSNCWTLHDIYTTYSVLKSRAWNLCYCLYSNDPDSVKGSFKIIGYNSQTFTVAWKTLDGLRVETRCNSYLIETEDF